jgi:hypothetical protein
MVKEIIVLQDSGIPMFHYSVSGTQQLDEIVAAFLSAIGAFAQEVGKEAITVISLADNKFVWEKKGNLYFIALVDDSDSAEIYRVILKDLSEQFVSTYYNELMKEEINHKVFFPFIDVVEMLLQKFDGIPGLARRYKTALLPKKDLSRLKNTLLELETHPDIHRGSVVTNDNFIVVSNLRGYELEDMLDLTSGFVSDTSDSPSTILVNHKSLEPNSSFFLYKVEGKGVCAFVVKAGKTDDDYIMAVKPALDLVKQISFAALKLVYPTHMKSRLSFDDYDVVIPIKSVTEVIQEVRILFTNLSEKIQQGAMTILNHSDGNTTVTEINDKCGFARENTDEIIAHLITKGIIHIARLYPKLGKRDDRFSAYLEVIGLPQNEYIVLERIWNFCNGKTPIQIIAEKSSVPVTDILKVLRALGNQVNWTTKPKGEL